MSAAVTGARGAAGLVSRPHMGAVVSLRGCGVGVGASRHRVLVSVDVAAGRGAIGRLRHRRRRVAASFSVGGPAVWPHLWRPWRLACGWRPL